MIIADQDADAEFIAADLLAQAEHDPSSSAVLITNSEKVMEKVEKELAKQTPKLLRKKIIDEAEIVLMQTETIRQAIDLLVRQGFIYREHGRGTHRVVDQRADRWPDHPGEVHLYGGE